MILRRKMQAQPYNELHASQRRMDDWTEDAGDDAPIVARVQLPMPPNYVAPAPLARPVKVEVLPPATMPDPPAANPLSRAQSNVTGTYLDRATGFSHVTGRLALAMGGLGVLVAIVGMGAPVFSLAVLAWFGSLYSATWALAYLLHTFVSAEGAAWLHVWQGWKWLGREQRHRHNLERYAAGMDRKGRR